MKGITTINTQTHIHQNDTDFPPPLFTHLRHTETRSVLRSDYSNVCMHRHIRLVPDVLHFACAAKHVEKRSER